MDTRKSSPLSGEAPSEIAGAVVSIRRNGNAALVSVELRIDGINSEISARGMQRGQSLRADIRLRIAVQFCRDTVFILEVSGDKILLFDFAMSHLCRDGLSNLGN
jgi:hypothetical protein